MDTFSKLKKQIERLVIDRRLAVKSYHNSYQRFKQTKRTLRHVVEAQRICQTVAAAIQQRVHDKICHVVSRCLETVFDEPYQFKIEFEKKRGKTEANLVFLRNGHTFDPMESTGGGAVDVACFALRLSCLLLTKPPLDRVLLLDEPFRFVSEEYRPRLKQLLETLSMELKVQIIMVTHMKDLRIGKTIRIR